MRELLTEYIALYIAIWDLLVATSDALLVKVAAVTLTLEKLCLSNSWLSGALITTGLSELRK